MTTVQAPGIRFTDGSTIVEISDGIIGILLKYQPKNKDAETDEITEECKFLAIGELVTIRDTIEKLNRLFRQAKIYSRDKVGTKIYVERYIDSATGWWRSLLVEALPLPEPSTLDSGLINEKMEFSIAFTRKNYWEGEEMQVPLTNSSATRTYNSITIYDHDDSGSNHDNWVSIAQDDVFGDLPGPARVEITNSQSGWYTDRYYIGQNYTDPANFSHILEAEYATGASGTSDSYCSGGEYVSITVTSGAEQEILKWSLDSTAQVAAAGRWYKPLVRFRWDAGGGSIMEQGGANPISYRMIIKIGTATIFTGSLAYRTGELPPIRIPPQLGSLGSLGNIDLVLCASQNTGTSKTIGIDFVELQPLDGWRKLVLPTYLMQYTYRLIDDAIEGEAYMDTGSGSGKVAAKGRYGSQILLEPAKLQRLYFLWEADGLWGTVDAKSSIKVFYRPRRLTLN
jgi:hypothetical protein